MDSENLTAAILDALLESTRPRGMSLVRLAKQLKVSASTLMRHLSGMDSKSLGSVQGPGWIQLILSDDRWLIEITAAGKDHAIFLHQASKILKTRP